MSNRQIKDGLYRQRNDIHLNNVPNRDQSKHPTRKTRMGNRQRNNNQGAGRQFELNRNRASGMRQRIQFNDITNNTHSRRFKGQNYGRESNLATTINPLTVWPSTILVTPKVTATSSTTAAPLVIATDTPVPSNVISNDVTYDSDNKYQQRNEESERLRHEEKLRRKKAEYLWSIEQDRIKETRQHDLEVRHQKEATEKVQSTLVNEPIQREQTQSHRPEHHKTNTQHAQQLPAMQNNLDRRQNERTNNVRAVQTNEIFDGTVSTTTVRSLEVKRRRNKQLHERISRLSPEAQALFFQRIAEKKKKRAN